MRGAGRAATLKNAKQKTVEVHAQEISKIAIGLNAAFTVPRISISHQPAPHRDAVPKVTHPVLNRDTSVSNIGALPLSYSLILPRRLRLQRTDDG